MLQLAQHAQLVGRQPGSTSNQRRAVKLLKTAAGGVPVNRGRQGLPCMLLARGGGAVAVQSGCCRAFPAAARNDVSYISVVDPAAALLKHWGWPSQVLPALCRWVRCDASSANSGVALMQAVLTGKCKPCTLLSLLAASVSSKV